MSKRYKRSQPTQQKANPAYAGVTLFADVPQPVSMPRNYKSFAKEGYSGNDTLYKVVTYGIQNAAAIPPRLYTDRTMTKEITSHPLLDKLDTPNNEQDGVFFRESVLGYYLIAGNSYLYANRVAKSGPPDELWALQPDLVHPIVDRLRGIVGYQYDNWTKEKNPIAADLIGHMRTWNPNNQTIGMSAVEVAAIIIDQQTAARKWNLSLLQNKMVPAGAWTTTALLSANERSKLEARINEKMAGYQNAGKIPVLDGSLEFHPTSVNASEMDWLQSVQYNAAGIANLWNMPPQLIGDTSSTTYDNMDQAKSASYTEYIFPMLDKLYALLNRWLVTMYPDLQHAYLYYDKTTVEVVQSAIQARLTAAATRGNTAYMQGVAMLDEAREMQGLPPLPSGSGQVFRLGAVLVPVEKLADYAEQSLIKPAAPPVPSDEPLQGDPNAHDASTEDIGVDQPDSADHPASGQSVEKRRQHTALATKALDLSTAEEKSAYMASMEKTRAHWEAVYSKEIANYFDHERAAVINAMHASMSTGVLAGRVEGVLNSQHDTFRNILMDLYKDVCVDVGTTLKKVFDNENGKKANHIFSFGVSADPEIIGSSRDQIDGMSHRAQGGSSHQNGQNVDSLQSKGRFADFIALFGESQLKYLLTLAGTKIRQISTVTLAKVRLELTDGVVKGESIIQLAKRVDGLYLNQIIPNRSMTIAATEVVASSNYASVEAAKQSELTLNKVWLSTRDTHTRPAHADADGQKVAMDGKFDVGGDALDYPGDASGSPGNIIGCRCTVYYERVVSSDDSGTEEEDDATTEKQQRRMLYKRFMREVLS